MKKIVIFILIIFLFYLLEGVNSNDKQEVWNIDNKKSDRILSYPYQEGFPAWVPREVLEPINIADIDNDLKKEIALMIRGYFIMYLYSHDGLLEPYWIIGTTLILPLFLLSQI